MARQPQGAVGGGGSLQAGIQQGGQVGKMGGQAGGHVGQAGGQMGVDLVGGQVGGGQIGGGQMGGGQMGGQGITIDQALSPQMQDALYGFVEAAKVCAWCADQCIDEGPGMAQCIRLCLDVVDLAQLNFTFLARDSVFGPDVAATFVEVASECARECGQHSHAHCQECAQVLDQVIQSVQSMLGSFGGQGATQGIQTTQQGISQQGGQGIQH